MLKYRENEGRNWLDNLKLGYGGTKTEMQRLLADAEKDFIRIHQSFLVNALKIKALSKEAVELSGNITLPVSKSRATAVKEAYLWSKR